MTEVTLHVYDVTNQKVMKYINMVTKDIGHVGGAFHGGVEVYGVEYSFGWVPEEYPTGVFQCDPKGCTQHVYKESVSMGRTEKTEGEFLALLDRMKKEWPGPSYDLFTHNCCHFSTALIKELRCEKEAPAWLNRLAPVGGKARDLGEAARQKGVEANRSMKADSKLEAVKAKASNLVGAIGAKFGKK